MAEPRSSLTSAVAYRDPKAALRFLEAAFGFEPVMVIEDQNGVLVHSEMRFNEALIMVGGEWSEDIASPASIGGRNTQTVHLRITGDVDAHCERARKAGMQIVAEPQTQFYGDRTYRCKDPEGHLWTVGQTVKPVSREEAEQASGLKIEGWI